jgi:site-specific recombinase XerD
MSEAKRHGSLGGKLDKLATSWERSLAGRNISGRTVVIYLNALAQLEDYLLAEGLSTDVADITRDHMRAYFDRRLGQVKASTTSVSYRAQFQFFKWCIAEGVLERSPLDKVPAPMVIVEPVPVLRPEQPSALLATCTGRDFPEVRDLALLRLFIDSGIRRGEMAGLTIEDVDLSNDIAWVLTGATAGTAPERLSAQVLRLWSSGGKEARG